MWLWCLAHLHPHRRMAMFSGVQTEDGQPGSLLHTTEPSLHNCLTHRQKAFGAGASCQFISQQNLCWVSIIDPVRINSSTAHTQTHTHTNSLSTQQSISTNFTVTTLIKHPVLLSSALHTIKLVLIKISTFCVLQFSAFTKPI